MAVDLPADSICEVGVPGVRGLNEALFGRAKVSDRNGVVATKEPSSGNAIGLTYCPNEIFVLDCHFGLLWQSIATQVGHVS